MEGAACLSSWHPQICLLRGLPPTAISPDPPTTTTTHTCTPKTNSFYWVCVSCLWVLHPPTHPPPRPSLQGCAGKGGRLRHQPGGGAAGCG